MLRHALPWVSLFSLVLAILPATAQNTLYENGPINGTTNAWTINGGYNPSDSFTLTTASTINGLSFGAWVSNGDLLESVQVEFSQYASGTGTVYFNQQVELSQSGCSVNGFGFDVCTETSSFNGPALNAGTYWLTLQNAVDTDGDPVYWDENSGIGCHSVGCPSMATDSSIGSISSEAFTVLGTSGGGGTTPEPDSLLLFASGVVSSIIILRRKFL